MSVSVAMDPVDGYAATWLDDPAEALTGCLHAFGLKEDDEEEEEDSDEETSFLKGEQVDLGFLDDDDALQFDEFGIRVDLDNNRDNNNAANNASNATSELLQVLGSPAKNKAYRDREERDKEPVFELNEFVLGARVPLLKMRHIKTNMDIGMFMG